MRLLIGWVFVVLACIGAGAMKYANVHGLMILPAMAIFAVCIIALFTLSLIISFIRGLDKTGKA